MDDKVRELIRQKLVESAPAPDVEALAQKLAEARDTLDRLCNPSLSSVLVERLNQDNKWGEQNHDPFTYLTILTEEVGELAQAALQTRFGGSKGGLDRVREEAVQTAAVALAIVECLDRAKWEWPVLSALQPAQAGVKKCKRCNGVGMEELWLGELVPCRDCNTKTHSAPQKPAQAEPEEQKCCQYCAHFEGDGCPVKDASPWSRWGNWCNVFAPRRSVGRPIRLAPAEQALEERRVGERRVVRPLTRITGGRVIYSENESWWECRLPGSDRRKETR